MVARTRIVDVEVAWRNEGTRVARPPRAQVLAPPVDVQELLERIHGWRAEHPEGAALALIVRRPSGVDVVVKQADRGAPLALIVGRHTCCDVVLDDASGASLRHAAVILWPEGEARAAAVDLRSEDGLVTRRGELARQVSSTRAFAFSAGAAEVMALVAQPDAPFAVRWVDQLDAELSGALVDAPIAASTPEPGRSRSSIAPSPSAPWERSVIVRTRIAGLPAPAVPEEAIAVRITRDELEHGVVLGRYPRCHRTTALADDVGVSRVHCLVFARDDALWAVDTASTGGTSLAGAGSVVALGEGRRIARLREDMRLLLAGVDALLVLE